MANGTHTKAEWDRMEVPLQQLDDCLEKFAKCYGLALTRVDPKSPGRWLRWGESVARSIAIYPHQLEPVTYSVGLAAVEFRNNKMYWKRDFPLQSVSIQELVEKLPPLLEVSRTVLESWSTEKLEFARNA